MKLWRMFVVSWHPTGGDLMSTSYSFHPEALFEYAGATNYHLQEASPRVADGFVTAVESAVTALISAPSRWRVVEDSEIRRYVFSRFLFVISIAGNRSMSESSSTPSCIAAASRAIGITALNETD